MTIKIRYLLSLVNKSINLLECDKRFTKLDWLKTYYQKMILK